MHFHNNHILYLSQDFRLTNEFVNKRSIKTTEIIELSPTFLQVNYRPNISEKVLYKNSKMFAKVIISLVVVFALFGSLNANVVSEEQEEDCPQICPLLYSPICGTDGINFREFSNPCELKSNNCRTERAAVKRKFSKAI